jgi:hypothetical protein
LTILSETVSDELSGPKLRLPTPKVKPPRKKNLHPPYALLQEDYTAEIAEIAEMRRQVDTRVASLRSPLPVPMHRESLRLNISLERIELTRKIEKSNGRKTTAKTTLNSGAYA